jgi:hypothetical protein
MYASSMMSKCSARPPEVAWQAGLHAMHYQYHHRHRGITYSSHGNLEPVCYYDSGFNQRHLCTRPSPDTRRNCSSTIDSGEILLPATGFLPESCHQRQLWGRKDRLGFNFEASPHYFVPQETLDRAPCSRSKIHLEVFRKFPAWHVARAVPSAFSQAQRASAQLRRSCTTKPCTAAG